MPSLDNLNDLLTEAAKLLNNAAEEVRDNKLNKHENIKKIGESLVNIYEIQLEIYKVRPDLTPDILK